MYLIRRPVASLQPEIQALQKFWGMDPGQLITCSIFRRDGCTILKIKSEPMSGTHASDYYIHERNINRLYGELRFKLESFDKLPLIERLADEKILWNLWPLEYQFLEFTGTITPSRLLLHKNQLVWTELPLHEISTLTRGKENTKKGKPGFAIGISLIILYAVMTAVVTITSSIPLPVLHWSFSPFLIAGIISLLIGLLITFDHYLLISTPTESFKIYAKRPILFRLHSLLSVRHPYPLSNSNAAPLPSHLKIQLPLTPHPPLAPEKCCPFCGMKTPTNAPFCPKCGSSV